MKSNVMFLVLYLRFITFRFILVKFISSLLEFLGNIGKVHLQANNHSFSQKTMSEILNSDYNF